MDLKGSDRFLADEKRLLKRLFINTGAGRGSRLLLSQKSSVPRGSKNRKQVSDFCSLTRPVGPYGSSSLKP